MHEEVVPVLFGSAGRPADTRVGGKPVPFFVQGVALLPALNAAVERSRLVALALRPGFRLKARSPSIEPSGRGR